MAVQNIPDNNDRNAENMRAMPLLPPGFGFCPSDEELFRYYLVNKNERQNPDLPNCYDYNVIRELEVYGYSPMELSENPYFVYGSRGVRRHWYFYTAAIGPVERQRRVRAVNCGFWLMTGTGNDAVVGRGGELLGTKSCFVFYWGNSIQNAAATEWTMHEFSLPDHAQASFMLYRLFAKRRTDNSSSSARHHGVVTYEAAREDVTSGNAIRLITEIHQHVPDGQIPAPVHLNQTIYRNSMVNHHYGYADGAGIFDADFAAPPATGAPRVDYIELNDFFCPP